MNLKPIVNQVVVLMGASSGIGRETALRLAKRGAKVVIAARSEAGLRSLEEEIRERGGEASAVVADVSEFEQVEAVAQRAVEEYGRLDTWVHLAAAGLFAPFDKTQPEEFRRVVDVDLMGQVYGAMAALPHIKHEGRGEHRGSRGCSDSERLASEGGGAPMKGGDCIPPQLSSLGAAENISGNVYAYKSRRSVWESREDLPSVRVLAGA